jgi:hypothetical protein
LCCSLGIIVNVAGSFTSAELMPGFLQVWLRLCVLRLGK